MKFIKWLSLAGLPPFFSLPWNFGFGIDQGLIFAQ
jgi:hypothetical protein